MNLRLKEIITGAGLGLFLSGFVLTASADEIDEQYKNANIKRGAQLYDDWVRASDQNSPSEIQPLYGSVSNVPPEETWYCSQCHGFDYGAKSDTVASIKNSKGKLASEIYRGIEGKGTKHDFGQFLTKRELLSLTRFIKDGTYDFDSVIGDNGKINGDIERGVATFNNRCAPCHSGDGNRYDFDREKDGIQGLGYLTNQDPKRAFHRTLWGKPGTGMPSWIKDFEKSYEDVIDVLTYAQSLKK